MRLITIASALCLAAATVAPAAEHYLFSYFKGNGEDGLHLAHSNDGIRWTALNSDESLLTPTVGEDRLMRDPSIVQGPDGVFHMVWTTGWHDQGIGIAHSKDLIHWSEQRRIGVMDHEPKCRNCWAPEIFYDEATKTYLIFWASTIDGRFPETANSCENNLNHRIYYVTTKDFEVYSPTQLFFDPGFAVIDSFLVREGAQWVLISKNETRFPEPRKDLFTAMASSAKGPYRETTQSFSPAWVEGPSALQVNDRWFVYFDEYTRQRYQAMVTRDFVTWEELTPAMTHPQGMRHGTAFSVAEDVATRLLQHASAGTESLPTSNEGILTGGADPAIVATQNDAGQTWFYVASTGRGLHMSVSRDLRHWQPLGRVFTEDVPAWAKQEVPESRGIWAPDLSFHNGQFYLYYSVSSFGSQRSVIGLAINKTLDPDSEDDNWIDHGKVIESFPGQSDFNAIDPALFVDHDGTWYLFFGSFWSGIKMVELDPATGKPFPDAELAAVAARPRHPTHAIEAPYVIARGDYYYLFTSWDRCCDGADSDYKVVVGRSPRVTGPFVDADGNPMLDGGGTLILAGNDRWRGPGHNSVVKTSDGEWIAHHTYDMVNLKAQRILQIRPLSWTPDGWPKVGEPISEPLAADPPE